MHPAQVPHVGPAQDGMDTLPLMMCKNNLCVEPSLWLEYEAREANATFDLFIDRKRAC